MITGFYLPPSSTPPCSPLLPRTPVDELFEARYNGMRDAGPAGMSDDKDDCCHEINVAETFVLGAGHVSNPVPV